MRIVNLIILCLALGTGGAHADHFANFTASGTWQLNVFGQLYPPTTFIGNLTIDATKGTFSAASFNFLEPFNVITGQENVLGTEYELDLRTPISQVQGCSTCFDNMSFLFSENPAALSAKGGPILGGGGAFEDCGPCTFAILSGSIAAIPEPSTWTMLLIGLAGIGVACYRRSANRFIFQPPTM
jgi:hypothetical protein